MFSIGASIGLLGGAALMKKVKYNEAFFIVGPIATVISVAFYFTMAEITPMTIVRWCKTKASTKTDTHRWKSFKTTMKKVAAIDFLGALLITGGAGSFLTGITMVSKYFFWLLLASRITGVGVQQKPFVLLLLVVQYL